MKNNYVSSITTKYGDVDKVKNDIKTLNEILLRQGTSLLIDVIAESCGNTVNKFKLPSSDRAMLMISLCDELEQAIKERI